MPLSEVNSNSVNNTVNTPEVRKKRDADAKLAVGITLIVLGVLAAAAAVVLSFCFGMVLIPIIVGAVSLALGITGIVLAILSKENKKTDAPSSNDLDSSRLVGNNESLSSPSSALPAVDSPPDESDSDDNPLPPPSTGRAPVNSAGNESDSDDNPLPPPPRALPTSNDAALPPPPRALPTSNDAALPPPPRALPTSNDAALPSPSSALPAVDSPPDESDDDTPPPVPPRRRDRGSPAVNVSDDDQDKTSHYRQPIGITIQQLKQQKGAQSRIDHRLLPTPGTVARIMDQISDDESTDGATSSESDGEWEDRSLPDNGTKRGMVHRVAGAFAQGAQRAVQSIKRWNPFASAGK